MIKQQMRLLILTIASFFNLDIWVGTKVFGWEQEEDDWTHFHKKNGAVIRRSDYTDRDVSAKMHTKRRRQIEEKIKELLTNGWYEEESRILKRSW